jgi:hypothetical protein
MTCTGCGAPVAEGNRFCRACGAPVAATTACPRCGRQLTPGGRCGDCATTEPDAAVGPDTAATARVARRIEPMPPPPLPPPPSPPAVAAGSPPRRVSATALLLGLLAAVAVVVAGVVAGLGLFGGGADQGVAALPTNTGAGQPTTTVVVPAPEHAAPVPPPTPTTTAAPAPTPEPVISPPPATPPAPAPPPPLPPVAADPVGDSPTGVMRRYWKAIGDADYDVAFDTFTASRKASISRTKWVSDQRSFAPAVHVVDISLAARPSSGRALVNVDVVTRDRGTNSRSDGSRCQHFAGRVGVVRSANGWRYRPGAQGATLIKRGSLLRGDPRCSPLF